MRFIKFRRSDNRGFYFPIINPHHIVSFSSTDKFSAFLRMSDGRAFSIHAHGGADKVAQLILEALDKDTGPLIIDGTEGLSEIPLGKDILPDDR